jgi:hypothetical protein
MNLPVWTLMIVLGTLGSDNYRVLHPATGLTYEQCQMIAGVAMQQPPPILPISFQCVKLEEI